MISSHIRNQTNKYRILLDIQTEKRHHLSVKRIKLTGYCPIEYLNLGKLVHEFVKGKTMERILRKENVDL